MKKSLKINENSNNKIYFSNNNKYEENENNIQIDENQKITLNDVLLVKLKMKQKKHIYQKHIKHI